MSDVIRHRLRVSKFLVELREDRNSQVIIMRNDRGDLPHLTITFRNPSKAINIHLKKRKVGGKEIKTEIGKIAEEAMGKALQSFIFHLMPSLFESAKQMKEVRPGWLARKGYRLALFDAEAEILFAKTVAPERRYHGKNERYVTPANFEEYVSSLGAEDILINPSALHDLKEKNHTKPLFAYRVFGKHRPLVIPLILFPTANGSLRWFNINALIKCIKTVSEDQLSNIFRELLPADTWSTIHSGMELNELGISL